MATPFVLIETRPSLLDRWNKLSVRTRFKIISSCTFVFVLSIFLYFTFREFPQNERFFMEYTSGEKELDRSVAVDLDAGYIFEGRWNFLIKDERLYDISTAPDCHWTDGGTERYYQRYKVHRFARRDGKSDDNDCTYYKYKYFKWCMKHGYIIEFCQDPTQKGKEFSCTPFVKHSKIKKRSPWFDLESYNCHV
ncbi:hypothetical protein GEMRC1_004657 [Eukaryota sp. GEM-RC1]